MWFTEVAADVGLDFVHNNGSRGEFEIFEVMGAGAALIDYDADGDLDVFLVQGMPIEKIEKIEKMYTIDSAQLSGPSDRLFRNDLQVGSDGHTTQRFVDVTLEAGIQGAAYGFGVAVGDANQDGWLDIYVTNLGRNRLWVNQGDGTFKDGTDRCECGDPGMGASATFADLDGDGLHDLFVANYIDYNLANPRHCSNRLGKRDYCGPAVFEGAQNVFFRGLGDGQFERASMGSGQSSDNLRSLGVVVADLDRDGRVELVVANDSDRNEAWTRSANGSWTEQADFMGLAVSGDGIAEGSMGIAVGDYDGDNDLDLLMSHLAGETNTLLSQAVPGVFLDSTNSSGAGPASFALTGFGAAFFDAQLDGNLDLLVVNGRVCRSRIPVGTPEMETLAEPNLFFAGSNDGLVEMGKAVGFGNKPDRISRALVTGDLDNDGDIDLLVTNNGAETELWRNDSTLEKAWIGLAFSRGENNGWATDLQVMDGQGHLRVSVASGSYLSSSDPRIVLPCEPAGMQVSVRWEGGADHLFEVAGCNRYHVLRYEDGAAAPPSNGAASGAIR